MNKKEKIYFVSDLHFGTPNFKESLQREKKFVRWLSSIEKDASKLFLLGDVFDFWFDYNTVVPKGFVRVLGKLAELSDNGLEIHYFKGNHDMWIRDYFQNQFNAIIHSDTYTFKHSNKTFFIGHGDGKGPKDKKYKFLKKIFRNPFFQWLFKWIHPDIGMAIATSWSQRSRYGNGKVLEKFEDEEKEWLVHYCRKKQIDYSPDFFIFGHRHLPLDLNINNTSKYINLGDWLNYFSFAVFDGNELKLEYFEN